MTDNELQNAIAEFKTARLTADTNFCDVYQKVKPFLNTVISIVKLIPIWGGTAAEAITLLITVLDKVCPVPAAAVAHAV
jgi:hypothetical protein